MVSWSRTCSDTSIHEKTPDILVSFTFTDISTCSHAYVLYVKKKIRVSTSSKADKKTEAVICSLYVYVRNFF